jgi:hypothetical protein
MLRNLSLQSRKSSRNAQRPAGRCRRTLNLDPLEQRSMLSAGPFDPGFDPGGMSAADFISAAREYVQSLGSTAAEYSASVAGSGHGDFLAVEQFSATDVSSNHFTMSIYDFTFVYYTSFNNAPIADAGGPYAIAEGSPLALDASGSSDADADPLTYSWDLNGDGVFDDATGANPTLDWSQLEALGAGDDGVYSISVQVDDGFGGTDQAETTFTVENEAPKAEIVGAPETSPEGTPISLESLVADAGTADTHTLQWNVTKDGQDYAAGDAESFEFTPDDNGSYEVTLTVTDDDGGVGVAISTIDVTNVAPQLENVTVPDLVDEGDSFTLSGAIVDPGAADRFHVDIDWGDGSSDGFCYAVGTTNFSEDHTYESGGVYTIGLTVKDDDQGSTSATATAVVTGAGVNNGVLQVVGSAGDDHAIVSQLADGRFVVTGDFLKNPWQPRILDAAGVERVDMLLGQGNDLGLITRNVHTPSMLDGGAGNDRLAGGSGNNVLLGGEGRDLLLGGAGSNLLVGGLGQDMIVGKGSDILVGGTTAYDADPAALWTLMSEWTSPRSVGARTANLGGAGDCDRLNGQLFLTAAGDSSATVFNDNARDLLVGDLASDLVFAETGVGDDLGVSDWLIDFGSGGSANA